MNGDPLASNFVEAREVISAVSSSLAFTLSTSAKRLKTSGMRLSTPLTLSLRPLGS
jgi:hypothetical protein